MKKQICAVIAVLGLGACSSVPSDPWVLIPDDMEFLIRQETTPLENENSAPVSVQDMLSRALAYAQDQDKPQKPKKLEIK